MTAPGWAKHLAGIDPKSVTSRAALAQLPVLRKASLPALQKEMPPFGGFNVTPPGKAKRLFMSPGPIFEPEGQRGRLQTPRGARCSPPAFAKATLRSTAFPIISRPAHSFLEAGAQRARLRGHSRAVSATPRRSLTRSRSSSRRPYVGTPDFLKILPRCGRENGQGRVPRSSVGSCPAPRLPASLRKELGDRGVAVKADLCGRGGRA